MKKASSNYFTFWVGNRLPFRSGLIWLDMRRSRTKWGYNSRRIGPCDTSRLAGFILPRPLATIFSATSAGELSLGRLGRRRPQPDVEFLVGRQDDYARQGCCCKPSQISLSLHTLPSAVTADGPGRADTAK